ncbi:MAG: filamentous hemagglutinin N-terminal domain-containing protein [Gammaproteobacteria bacterium]
MTKDTDNRRASALPAILLLLISSSGSEAEITLDGTLGPGGLLTGPQYLVPAEDGTQFGRNLFHSFGVFNINTGESATFTGPNSIQNVLGRVTGGEASIVDGLLRSEIPGASLYLINPAGVIFGPDAQLDVQGSFHVSTADYLRLGAGGRFAATGPQESILTVAPPSAFGFLTADPAPFVAAGSNLEVPAGRTLSAVAGDVRITGGSLSAANGRINIASASSQVTNGKLDVKSFARLGNIEMSRAAVNTSGEGGGKVAVRADRLTIEEATIQAATFGNNRGGLIDIQLDGDLVVDNGFVGAATLANGSAGTVSVRADNITIANGSVIDSSSLATGSGGQVILNDTGKLQVTGSNDQGGRSRVRASTLAPSGAANAGRIVLSAPLVLIDREGIVIAASGNSGRGGTINIDAGKLFLERGGQIDVSTFGPGDAGNVAIEAPDVSIDASNFNRRTSLSGIFANAQSATGDAGNISILAKATQIVGARNSLERVIDSRTFGTGRGGDLKIIAKTFDLNAAILTAGTAGSGRGGDVLIKVARATLASGAQIDSTADRAGRGGNVRVVAADGIVIVGQGELDATAPTGIFNNSNDTGAAGNLTIITGGSLVMRGGRILTRTLGGANGGILSVNARALLLTDGAQIFSGIGNSALTNPGFDTGTGRGGDLTIAVADTLSISGRNGSFRSGLFTDAQVGLGDAGDLSVSAAKVEISELGTISTESTGASRGNAGDIDVRIADVARLINGSIEAAANNTDGGNISLTANSAQLTRESDISSSVFGDPHTAGGNVTINGGSLVLLDASEITATAVRGQGGFIAINPEVFLYDGASVAAVLDASSGTRGNDGTVEVNSPDNDISGSITRLPASFLNAAALLSRRCAARDADETSSFIIAGRGGVPGGPEDWALSSYDSYGGPQEAKNARTGVDKKRGSLGYYEPWSPKDWRPTDTADNQALAAIKVSCGR